MDFMKTFIDWPGSVVMTNSKTRKRYVLSTN